MVYRIKHFGRLPHVPDRRDYSPNKAVEETLGISEDNFINGTTPPTSKKLKTTVKRVQEGPKKLAISVDNTKYDTPIEDQGNLGSCVLFSSYGALEYLHHMLYGKYLRFSKLFGYAMVRRMNGWPIDQDTGAYIRSGLGALVRVGALQDRYWPYDLNTFAAEPTAWHFPLADDYETLKYFRLDYPNTTKDGILQRIKTYITNKFPVIVGFYCFETIDSEYCTSTGNVPYPAANEANVGGHAVMALGYEDNRKITNPIDGSTTTGAFRFRNSWGTGWGQEGYGFLPYDYLMEEKPFLLADEFYSITRAEFLESWKFDE